jgi:hypothetical protein
VQQYSTFSYPTEELVETVGTAVTILEDMISEVAHLGTVESCITGAINPSAWGHLIPSSYCDVGRFCCRVFKV